MPVFWSFIWAANNSHTVFKCINARKSFIFWFILHRQGQIARIWKGLKKSPEIWRRVLGSAGHLALKGRATSIFTIKQSKTWTALASKYYGPSNSRELLVQKLDATPNRTWHFRDTAGRTSGLSKCEDLASKIKPGYNDIAYDTPRA